MSKTVVIYHKADFDGIFCREIAHKFLPDAELIGWDYGEPTPAKALLDGLENLYLLDISVPDLMDHPKLIWIDHHKSAMDKYHHGIPGYRIDGVAACRLAWQWFQHQSDVYFKYGVSRFTEGAEPHNNNAKLPSKEDFVQRRVAEPMAVRLAGEYDIWDKRDPNAELFQHGLRSRELSQNLWDLLLVSELAEGDVRKDVGSLAVAALLEAGEAIQYAKTQENQGIITSYGFNVEFEGLVFLACNHARFNSQLFTAGIKPTHDALLGFNWTGQHWRVSLYHAPGKEHHDLSLIAVKHGGGGHKGACGFTCDKPPFSL